MAKSSPEDSNELAKLSPDCSFLLTHLIRNNDRNKGLTPKEKLNAILDIKNQNNPSPTLKANEAGWFGTESTENAKIFRPYTDKSFISPTQLKVVCFTDSSLAGLKAHRDVFKTQYGIAFDRDFLFSKGANPCLNIREELLKDTARNYNEDEPQSHYKNVHNFIPDQLVGFVNIIHESFDATHEREWRILSDFTFNYSDIKFVFCPENEFDGISHIQKNGRPVLFDLKWLDRI